MKILKNVCCALCVAVLCVGVASAKKVKKPEIIDSEGMALGKSTPKWVEDAVESNYSALSKDKEFEGKTIFIAKQEGKKLSVLKSWASNFDASGSFSKSLGNTVLAKSGSILEGDVDKGDTERYLKELVGTFSQTSFVGLEIKKSYWIQKRVYNDKKKYEDIYQYFLIYAIDKDIMKEQLANAAKKSETKTPTEQRVENEVASLIDEVQVISQEQ